MVLHPLKKLKKRSSSIVILVRLFPDNMNTICALLTSPDGHPVVANVICYHGDMADNNAQQTLQPLREFGPLLADQIPPMSYVEAQSMLDSAIPPSGFRGYWKSYFLKEIPDPAIDILISSFAQVPSPRTALLFQQFGGEASRIREDVTAFGHRKDGQYDFIIFSLWQNPSDDDDDDTNIH